MAEVGFKPRLFDSISTHLTTLFLLAAAISCHRGAHAVVPTELSVHSSEIVGHSGKELIEIIFLPATQNGSLKQEC